MCLLPLPGGGRGERFGSRTSRKKTVRGRRKESGPAGDMPLGGGEGAFEGQANGLSSIVGQGRRRKGREMSVTGYEKENEEDEE